MALRDKTLAELARLNSAIGPSFSDARPPGNTAATGTITTVAASALVDGETFTIDDGQNPAVNFEFDLAGDGVGAGNVAVVLDGTENADEVRDAVIAAINGVPNETFLILASDGGAGTVDLVNEFGGAQGNVAIAEAVTDAGFSVTGMSGGVDFPTTKPSSNGDGTDCEDSSRAVVIVKPTDGTVVFDILSRTETRDDAFEELNQLTDLEASTDVSYKQVINCAPEVELAVRIKSGTATLISTEVQIGPCWG
jgi:hypothetical protein